MTDRAQQRGDPCPKGPPSGDGGGDSMALAELVRKVGEGDFLRTVAEAVLQRLMEADVEGLIGAARHERSPDRLNYRNGYRDRALDTRLGSLQLRVPKLRPRRSDDRRPLRGTDRQRRCRWQLLSAPDPGLGPAKPDPGLKQREGGRIVSLAAIIAVAVNTDVRREIIGLKVGPSEAETFWSGFLTGSPGPEGREAGHLRCP